MCTPELFGGGKPPHDNSAELARQEEARRQARIAEGKGKIDAAFAPFDDSYFNKLKGDYEGYYTPQVNDQYQKARAKLMLALANTGNLTSSAGAGRIGDLTRKYEDEKVGVANNALAAVNDRRNQVEQNRSDLLSLNDQSADPSGVATQTAARIGSLQGPPTYSPLGDVFGSVLQDVPTGLAAEAQGYRGYNTGLFSRPKNAVKVVN